MILPHTVGLAAAARGMNKGLSDGGRGGTNEGERKKQGEPPVDLLDNAQPGDGRSNKKCCS